MNKPLHKHNAGNARQIGKPPNVGDNPIDHQLLMIVLAFLFWISASEVLCISLDTLQIGLIGHGLSLVVLLVLSALYPDAESQRIFLTLSLVPLIRLISLSLPLARLPIVYWYLLVGFLVFIAVVLVIRYAQFTPEQIGLKARNWLLQVLFGLFGIGLGYIEYLILRPAPLVGVLTLGQIWLPALILIIFTGILEELVFRGLMQAAFTKKFGPWLTILLVSLLFAVLHLGYGSLPDMVFVFVVAVLFGLVTRWTGSIIGVSLAHGLTNVTLFLIYPFIVG